MATHVESGASLASRPTGTVTFLFSDIEGSTQRWERDAAAMQDAVRRHDALMRSALEGGGGHVFKTVGDAFCAAFARPEAALAAALTAQRALAAEDFSAVDGVRVRMALHTGTADERDGDYFGPTVNRVARLLGIGHGGQVLLSNATAELVQGALPLQLALRDLGSHRLRDLARPERVYQLVAPDLPEAFGELRSLDAIPHNLPLQLTSFVGRQHEVGEIKTLLGEHRLVTLVGTGGAGKTRCALQAGAELLERSAGVWLIELAATTDPRLVAGVVGAALGVPETPNRPLLDTLVAYLRGKRLVLILDNCEHVIDEVRSVAATILRSAPDVRILATSREGLGIAGERLYPLPSLAVPPPDRVMTATSALRYGAAALFTDRALASNGRFACTDENAASVAEICRRLDGIPLALELAAARIKVLSPQQLAQKLDERFRVLTGGDRSALPRQQTMRALIDWSYDLLSGEEQALFRQLAVFAGGFTLVGASAVCTGESCDEMDVLDRLSSLVDKSLVQADPFADGTRYRLLESTRQYARERLVECGEGEAAARAHAAAYAAVAEELEATYDATPDGAWLAQAGPEMENWRAALEWSLGAGREPALGQRLAGALRLVWVMLAPAEGRRWVDCALTSVDASASSAAAAKLDLARARLESSFRHSKASYDAATRALARYRELGDALGTADAQRWAGLALLMLGKIGEGELQLQEAFAGASALGARKLTAWVLNNLATARQLVDDSDGARLLFAEALTVAKASGAERVAHNVASSLAELEFRRGDAPAALELAAEALGGHRTHNDPLSAALDLCNMAAYLTALGKYARAREHAREALSIFRDSLSEVHLMFAVQHLGAIPVLSESADDENATEQRARAARLLGFVDARLDALEASREYTERQEYEKMLTVLRETFPQEACAKLMNDGAAWNQAVAIAQALLV